MGSRINMDKAGNEAFTRCRARYGDSLVGTQVTEDEVFPVSGGQGVANALADSDVTTIVLEFGTFDKHRVGKAMGDHACLLSSELDAAIAERLRREIQTVFYPGTDDWLEMVWVRSDQIIRQALRGLCS